jgi:hypothetical protein
MRSTPLPRVALLCCVALCQASCLNVSPPGTAIASEPPGARVHVDGRDSGWVTPCRLALDAEETHVVMLRLEGYTPREVLLEPAHRHGFVDWRQAVNGVRSTIEFPILMPPGDLLLPFRELRATSPGRVFVRLRPADAP